MENDKEQRRREAARKRPIRTPDASILGGSKPAQTGQSESSQKYSGGLLKSGEGEHFERARQRQQSYHGIDAMPHSSDALHEKLSGGAPSPSDNIKVKKAGCMGVLLLAAALPLAVIAVALLR